MLFKEHYNAVDVVLHALSKIIPPDLEFVRVFNSPFLIHGQ